MLTANILTRFYKNIFKGEVSGLVAEKALPYGLSTAGVT
jgi:hypothetical protein